MNIQSVAIKNLWIYKTEEAASIRAINMTNEMAQIGYSENWQPVQITNGKWTIAKAN
jgi:hypothetical protein